MAENMTSDSTAKPKKRWGQAKKVRLLTFDALDQRTAGYQYAQDTRDAIFGDLGGADQLSTLERLQVENASLSAAILRDMQVRWLKGENVPVAEMVSVENTFNRTAASLGIQRRSKDITPATTRGELLTIKKDDVTDV
jgi:hypothetical protein